MFRYSMGRLQDEKRSCVCVCILLLFLRQVCKFGFYPKDFRFLGKLGWASDFIVHCYLYLAFGFGLVWFF